MLRSTFVLAAALTATPAIAADLHWPTWRGVDGTGYSADGTPPTEWSEDENIRWKTAIPGEGFASPVVVGDRIYLMTAVPTGKIAAGEARGQARGQGRGGRGPAKPNEILAFQVLAVDRTDGTIAWTKTVREEVPHEGKHQTSSYASTSVVTDGELLYCNFGSRGTYCLDLAGNVKWEKDFGDMRTRRSFGEGATPAVGGGMLVIPWDHEDDSFVLAVDKRTGVEKWRRPRDEATNWTTPLIVEVGGKRQAIVTGTKACIAYDLETGDEVWRCRGLTMNVIPTPMLGDGVVYLMSGFRGAALLAVRLDGAKGDLSDTDAILWSYERGTSYVPSGLLTPERIYFLGSNTGILTCLNAKDGSVHYAGQRLGDVRNVYASIVGANGYLYVCGREGRTAVIKEGPEFELVRINELDEGINASPAIVGDVMYIRGNEHLYCIAADKTASAAP